MCVTTVRWAARVDRQPHGSVHRSHRPTAHVCLLSVDACVVCRRTSMVGVRVTTDVSHETPDAAQRRSRCVPPLPIRSVERGTCNCQGVCARVGWGGRRGPRGEPRFPPRSRFVFETKNSKRTRIRDADAIPMTRLAVCAHCVAGTGAATGYGRAPASGSALLDSSARAGRRAGRPR